MGISQEGLEQFLSELAQQGCTDHDLCVQLKALNSIVDAEGLDLRGHALEEQLASTVAKTKGLKRPTILQALYLASIIGASTAGR